MALHPPLTDFPLALWVTSVAFDIASFWFGPVFVQLAFWNLVVALGIGVFTALTGVRDYTKIKRASPARRLGIIHAMFAVFAFIAFGVSVWFRTFQLDAQTTPIGALVPSLIGLVLAIVAGALGGRLVFRHGANVDAVPVRSTVLREQQPATSHAPRQPGRPASHVTRREIDDQETPTRH